MALRAIKDTYGYEPVGADQEVRRQLFAGQPVPPGLRLEDESAVEEVDSVSPLGYPHQYTEGHGGTAHEYARHGVRGAEEEKDSKQRSRSRSRS